MGYIELPDSMFADRDPAPAAPPPDPAVAREQAIADTTRAEEALNGFLAARQHALFEAPDAFYRQQGEDAIHAAPVMTQKLDALRNDFLDRLGNDAQRQRLGAALDAQMQLTSEGMDRHVAEQYLDWQRQTARDRIALLTKEAALHHNDDGLVDALGEAAASAARAHGQVGDAPPDPAAEAAAAALGRSGVFNAAILARLGGNDPAAAAQMLERVRDQLDPAHAEPLQAQVDAAQRLEAAKAYAKQVVPAETPSSPEQVEVLRDATLQRAAIDHVDDPLAQLLAQHNIDVGFDAHLNTLDKAATDRAAAVQRWLTTPDADGQPQTAPPPAELLNMLPPREQVQILAQLRANGRASDAGGANVLEGDAQVDPNIILARHEPGQSNTPQERDDGNEAQLVQAQTTKPTKAPAKQGTQPPKPLPLAAPEPKAVAATKGRERFLTDPHTSQNELDAAAQLLRDMRWKEREPIWKSMISATLPDTSPGTKRQAPLPEDWEAGLRAIDKQHVGLVELVKEAAKTNNIPPELLARVLHKETPTFDVTQGTKVVNGVRVPIPDTPTGIPQMFPQAAADAGVTIEALAAGTAKFQINAGAKYLAQQYSRFKDWPAAVAAYHSGYRTMDEWLHGSGPNFENERERRSDYVVSYRPQDKDGNRLTGRWGLVRENMSDPKVVKQIKDDLDHWQELKGYLPYIFLGNPRRYDRATGTAP